MTDTGVERIRPKHNERFPSFSQEFKKQTAEERFDKDDA